MNINNDIIFKVIIMNLFDIVPNNYFSIFSGKNKEIYIESLNILYSLLQNDEAVIKKSDFLSALKEREKNLNNFSFEEEDLSEEEKNDLSFDTPSSKPVFRFWTPWNLDFEQLIL